MLSRFEKTTVDFGKADINGVYNFEFKVNEGHVVEHVRKGCGCTDAYYDNGYVRGSLDLKAAVGASPKIGENPVLKTVTVYFRDGKDLKIPNGLKQEFNEEKAQETLYIKGVVLKEKEVEED